VIILGLFVFFGWLFAQTNRGQGIKITAGQLVRTLLGGVITGGFLILGFYVIGD
jgi:hypothetical protein